VESEPWRRSRLLENASRLRQRLRELGWNLAQSASQIIPLIIGSPAETMRLAKALREQGLWVGSIRPPSVPANESLLRIGLSAAHTDEMREVLVNVLQANAALQPTP
jgi:8-amino-7-oxononanoate synthase